MAVRRTTEPVTTGGRPGLATVRKIRETALAEADRPVTSDAGLVIDQRGEVLTVAAFASPDPAVYARDIRALWARAQESFLAIGQRLIAVREIIAGRMLRDPEYLAVPPGQRRRRADHDWAEFLRDCGGLTPPIASQLECVARAVSDGRLTRLELPTSYSAAYQLTTLSDDELAAARQAPGIVAPTATRKSIEEFKRRLRSARVDARRRAEERRRQILDAMARLRAELAVVEAELGETSVLPVKERAGVEGALHQ